MRFKPGGSHQEVECSEVGRSDRRRDRRLGMGGGSCRRWSRDVSRCSWCVGGGRSCDGLAVRKEALAVSLPRLRLRMGDRLRYQVCLPLSELCCFRRHEYIIGRRRTRPIPGIQPIRSGVCDRECNTAVPHVHLHYSFNDPACPNSTLCSSVPPFGLSGLSSGQRHGTLATELVPVWRVASGDVPIDGARRTREGGPQRLPFNMGIDE
jgi:hypothetical protein